MFVNQNEVRIVGMSRSGCHPIIGWILDQLDGGHCFLNCAEGKQDPYATARPLDDHSSFRTNLGGSRRIQAAEDLRHVPKEWLVISYEDSYLGHACSPAYEAAHDEWVGASARRIDVLVLRDPYNLFASRLHSAAGEVSQRHALRVWQQHAREVLGRQRRMLRPFVPIRYDRWVREPEYRAEIAHALGVPFSDRGFQTVPGVFGGSSFDGRRFDGRADRMRVFDRWRHLVEDPEFLDLFDATTQELAEAVFGAPPPELAALLDEIAAGRQPRRASG